MKKILTFTEYLMGNASYTKLQIASKETPYKQFVIGMKDGSEIAIDIDTYKKVKNYLERC
jgi:hypothetical protein